MQIPFTKAHGAGNDFLLSWAEQVPDVFERETRAAVMWPHQAQLVLPRGSQRCAGSRLMARSSHVGAPHAVVRSPPRGAEENHPPGLARPPARPGSRRAAHGMTASTSGCAQIRRRAERYA